MVLIDTIKHDLDVIANQNPNDAIIFAADLNQLNVTRLTQECGMTMINQDITHALKLSTIFCLCLTYLLLYDIQLYCENKAHANTDVTREQHITYIYYNCYRSK